VPLVSLSTAQLGRLIGEELGDERLVSTIQELGCDVEGRARVNRFRCPRCGHVTEALEHEDFNGACDGCGAKELVLAGSTDVLRINLLPVRPDMFDAAGLARCIRGFLGVETGLGKYAFPASGLSVRVEPGLEEIRPHIVAAVVRGLALDDELLRVLMRMQENLHWALGRDRRRASIGVYDLDTAQPDFFYRPVRPDGVRFVPLFGMPDGARPATPAEILAAHPKGTAYAHLLAGREHYPLLCDSAGAVLSLPPIINSDATRVTDRTRNLFIDVTGPDRNAIRRTLAVMAASLADLGGRVETVKIQYPDGRAETTPGMEPSELPVSAAEAGQVIGVPVSPEQVVSCLERMRHSAVAAGDAVRVKVAAYRADVMHPYDLIEDVAIAHGYQQIAPRLVPTMTVGRAHPREELAERCRRVMCGLGFLETMSLVLENAEENARRLRRAGDARACRLENPASVEQTALRRDLAAALLSFLRVNSGAELPQHIFEIGECYDLDPQAETGAVARLRAGAAMAGAGSSYADVRSVLSALGRELGLELGFLPVEHPSFIPGRVALVQAGGREIGVAGEVHPEVLEAFGVGQPVGLFDIDLSAEVK
jgi:phenylalanyl-tRNA synthetase beta chain